MIINLISGPRNVSTALMYSFAQRNDTTVIDEPFYGYYLKNTGIIHPGKKRIIQSMMIDINQITDQLIKDDRKGKVLFLKNMAHHHIEVSQIFLQTVTNVFLIRNPAELLISFSKVIKNPGIDDIGLKKSWELFKLLQDLERSPIVLDSGELLKNPEVMLKQLCAAVSIPFDEQMLSWPAGPREEDGIWAEYWYHNVHRSTGFVQSQPKEVQVTDDLQEVYQEAVKYYSDLLKHSIQDN